MQNNIFLDGYYNPEEGGTCSINEAGEEKKLTQDFFVYHSSVDNFIFNALGGIVYPHSDDLSDSDQAVYDQSRDVNLVAVLDECQEDGGGFDIILEPFDLHNNDLKSEIVLS